MWVALGRCHQQPVSGVRSRIMDSQPNLGIPVDTEGHPRISGRSHRPRQEELAMYRVFVAVIASSIAMSAAIAGTPRQQSGWVVIDTH